MDIAETSMALSAAKTQMQAGVGTLKKVLEVSTDVAEMLVSELKALDIGMEAPQIVDISV